MEIHYPQGIPFYLQIALIIQSFPLMLSPNLLLWKSQLWILDQPAEWVPPHDITTHQTFKHSYQASSKFSLVLSSEFAFYIVPLCRKCCGVPRRCPSPFLHNIPISQLLCVLTIKSSQLHPPLENCTRLMEAIAMEMCATAHPWAARANNGLRWKQNSSRGNHIYTSFAPPLFLRSFHQQIT